MRSARQNRSESPPAPGRSATLGREPEPEELRLAKRFVAQSGLSKATLPWQELAQALLLSNEFMFVD